MCRQLRGGHSRLHIELVGRARMASSKAAWGPLSFFGPAACGDQTRFTPFFAKNKKIEGVSRCIDRGQNYPSAVFEEFGLKGEMRFEVSKFLSFFSGVFSVFLSKNAKPRRRSAATLRFGARNGRLRAAYLHSESLFIVHRDPSVPEDSSFRVSCQ